MPRIFVFEHCLAGGDRARPGQAAEPVVADPTGAAALLTTFVDSFVDVGCDVATILADGVDVPLRCGEIERVADPAGLAAAFDRLARAADATLLIAPEIDDALARWTGRLEALGVRHLGCPGAVVELCSDKLRLAHHLAHHPIPTPATPATPATPTVPAPATPTTPQVDPSDRWIIKPRRGAGCQGVRRVAGVDALADLSPNDWVCQRYVEGTPASVALLVDGARAQPLPAGEQVIEGDATLRYAGGRWPLAEHLAERATRLAVRAWAAVAEGHAGFVGVVGVDLVLGEAEANDCVIEINARPTLSSVALSPYLAPSLAAGLLDPTLTVRCTLPAPSAGVWAVAIDGDGQPIGGAPASPVALDIGGANIKFASAGGAGCEAFPLWQRPDELADRLRGVIGAADTAGRGGQPSALAPVLVTMTGELCDCYATRAAGVAAILDAVVRAAGPRPVRVWSTAGRFVALAAARRMPLAVAAGNWHALATAVARRFLPASRVAGPAPAWLIDVGSTTTDIIPLPPAPTTPPATPPATSPATSASPCITDTDRLAAGQLVYLGVGRTPVMALASSLHFAGRSTRVMAERFATTADVMLLSDDGAVERPGVTDTADGRPMTRRCAAARLLRMVGSDLDTHGLADAVDLARQLRGCMLDRLAEAWAQVSADGPGGGAGGAGATLILAGSGAVVARELAGRVAPGAEVIMLADVVGAEASTAACAWALLELWRGGPGSSTLRA
ncbi:MAG: ATP-grasp domain-containing protein [Phycisphaeraceae bacterium]